LNSGQNEQLDGYLSTVQAEIQASKQILEVYLQCCHVAPAVSLVVADI